MGEPVDASGKMQPLFLYSFSRWVASHQQMFLGEGGVLLLKVQWLTLFLEDGCPIATVKTLANQLRLVFSPTNAGLLSRILNL